MSTPTKPRPRVVSTRLLRWYGAARRSLPWRESVEPYRIWVSEIMLQQTRVAVVVPYYLRFVERFPRLSDLARSGEEEVLALWSGLGYYRRARSLLEGARFVLEKHAGVFPRDFDAALRIPGVGPYTAAAVLSIAYNLAVPVVDGNVERVLTRLFRLEGDPRRAGMPRRLRAIAQELIPETSAAEFNQALMELGATICTPRQPACSRCPLEALCLSHQVGDVSSYPQTAPQRRLIPVTLQAAVLRQGGRYLFEKITEHRFLKGMWMFPFAADEGVDDLLHILGKKLDATFAATAGLKPVRHGITYRKITLHPSIVETSAPVSTRGQKYFRWARLSEIGSSVPVSSLALKIRERIREG